jgi:hypothetical protein
MNRPKIVTICGSMRFYEDMLLYASNLTLGGVIVLMPFVTGAIGHLKRDLDELHKRKIDMSHEILVVNPGGYIGESTRAEIVYAAAQGKVVEYTHGEVHS